MYWSMICASNVQNTCSIRSNHYVTNGCRCGDENEFRRGQRNRGIMTFCNDNASFRQGAFEGCMIGLSIGVVLGSVRALVLDGVPHSEDETPCKTLISHIIGGLLSGALVGVVYVFFKNCMFKRRNL
ncbi:hypothetical protein RUM44_005149 [Polyplax serrata]|uniref:Uncharacterized protein n=1 Tax=Polyplax serrata TaxID=468196 RepID=A0ABR1AEM9_POLSC